MTRTNNNGFILCPRCLLATNTKVLPDTRLKDFPLYCKKCKKEFLIDK